MTTSRKHWIIMVKHYRLTLAYIAVVTTIAVVLQIL